MSTAAASDDSSQPTMRPEQLLQLQGCLSLATQTDQGDPLCSTAPYAWQAPYFFILASTLAEHGPALQQAAQTQRTIAWMIVQDEHNSRQPYARTRLMLKGHVEQLNESTDQRYRTALDQLQQRHGEVVSVLSQLDDFSMFALNPKEGRWITGFGQAWRIDDAHLTQLSPLQSQKTQKASP